ncbi:PQQ-binding-like beta-propeller repeat protein [Streptomyces sp. SID3343]|uniref:outer membrane protein assembly factor BamB family protein n=1 Tax=Streptomyces sp. SID3343 TaxID=2690260 RepID=UPI00136D1DCC
MPFPNASQGGFVVNPSLPLFDPAPQATPYPYSSPPYGGPSGPTGPTARPTAGPAPAQPTPHGHGFVFGPPLDPTRIRTPRTRPILLRSTVLALAVLAVAGVGAVRQAGKDTTDYDNTGRRNRVAWALKDGRDGPPITRTPVADSRVLEGTWFRGDTVVRSELSRVVAYRVDTGATVWESPLPDGAAMCAAGDATDGPIAVVVYGVGGACDRIAGVDISSGREVWVKPRPDKDSLTGGGERLAVSQGVAVTADTAFRIKDGARLWAADRGFGAGCHVSAFRGGAALVANGRCGTTDTVWAVNPATGKPAWAHALPKGGTILGSPVVATSPVIVDEPVTTGVPRLTVLTDKGEPAYTIETGNPVISNALGPTPRILADERTIYIPGNNGQSLHTSAKLWANQIVAVDRATGNVRWVSALPAAVKALGMSVDSKAAPIRIDEDGGLRVWVNAGIGKPPRLVRFAAGDGHIRVVDEYPLRLGAALALDMPKPFEQDGRLFLVKEDVGDQALGYRLIVGG